ncbi:MAG: nicotinate-nicotinamide nucleotide adenylyltransferase [Myxococcota bacterium]
MAGTVAVYGGSFNPPHVGHLMVSDWLRWTARCDAVWWVPVRGHPFAKDLAPFEDRLALCEVAARLVGAEVCAVEGELPVPSYTVDTLTELARRHPGTSLRLVVGADVLPETDRWKQWDVIEARFAPIVVGRAGAPPVPDAVTFPEVSSTEIRSRVRAGLPVDHLVPAGILDRVRALWGHSSGAPPTIP